MTLRELITERYAVLHNLKAKTVGLFCGTLDRMAEHLGREPVVDDLNDLTITKFLRWRAVTKCRGRLPAAATVRKDQAHLSAIWNHLAKKRHTKSDGHPLEFPDLPRNLVKVPRKPPRGYTVQEVSALVRQAKCRRGRVYGLPAPWFWMSLLMAAWYTGERIGGLLRIRWGEVDLDSGLLTFLGENRKGGLETIQRSIPADLVRILRMHARGPADHVWPWLDTHDENSIYTSFRSMAKRAGVVPRGFHAIRKASGSYVKAGGGDATEHLGHANPRTTQQHYLDPDITGRQSALDFLPPLDLTGPAGGEASRGKG
jgi:integrase